eukprot:scaffold26122_cov127-Cylindrotheca_fusiformis.AAC.1
MQSLRSIADEEELESLRQEVSDGDNTNNQTSSRSTDKRLEVIRKRRKMLSGVQADGSNEGASSIWGKSWSVRQLWIGVGVIVAFGILSLYLENQTGLSTTTTDFTADDYGNNATTTTLPSEPHQQQSPGSDVVVKTKPPQVETEPPTAAYMNDANEPQETTTYKPRGQPLNEKDRAAMIDKWGSWTFDHAAHQRTVLNDDFYQAYPNRDVPSDQWPATSWQRSPTYLEPFLKESLALVERTQNAILEEYSGPNNNASKIFSLRQYDDDEILKHQFPGRGAYGGTDGGWTTRNTWAGLKRRLLHAIMTEDSFVVAMAGHSSAAGHGNLFQQSYTLQIQWILEAIFSRMGVRHESRNFGMGGLGTSQNGIAASSIYGPDVDFLIWDSGMTERELHLIDMLARQQIMGGLKVPIVWNMVPEVSLALLKHAGVEIGAIGTGMDGIPPASSVEEIKNSPWAVQYVNCQSQLKEICRENEYIGHCWIDRPDVTPPKKQKAEPGGRASWHPGNRKHQVTGRILTMTILQALKEAIQQWMEAPNYVMEDSAWHLTETYDRIKSAVSNLAPDQGHCYKTLEDKHKLGFLCNHPFHGRTEVTPRHVPAISNIRKLMPEADKVILPSHIQNSYLPPDVFNPDLHPPEGAIDVLNIVEAGTVPFTSILNPDYVSKFYKFPPQLINTHVDEPGLGIVLDTVSGDSFCDGTIDSFCDKGANNDCLLYSHNDGRNGLNFDAYSGWLLFNIPKIEHGYIVIRIESWHFPEEGSPKTWNSINNKGNTPTGRARNLKRQPLAVCADFRLEYMIDGKVTSKAWSDLQGTMEQGHIQRVVETLTLTNDPTFSTNRQVQVGIRILGCGHDKVWKLTHVYWS